MSLLTNFSKKISKTYQNITDFFYPPLMIDMGSNFSSRMLHSKILRRKSLPQLLQTAIFLESEKIIAKRYHQHATHSLFWQAAKSAVKNVSPEETKSLPEYIQTAIQSAAVFTK